MTLARVPLADLEIEDEPSFRHVGLYADLKAIVTSMGPTFLVPEPGGWIPWNRAVAINLLYWEPGSSDVLCTRSIAADVITHVAWHELARRHLPASVEASLLGESIASAFDAYLIGRLLGHSPDSSFLESQVAAMGEAALDAGVDEQAFEALLAHMSEAPETAFESLRSLLFDASLALLAVDTPREGLEALEQFSERPMAPLLHHYELAAWGLRARFERASREGAGDGGQGARALDEALKSASDSIAFLERKWVRSG
jgi:hypothetical protein